MAQGGSPREDPRNRSPPACGGAAWSEPGLPPPCDPERRRGRGPLSPGNHWSIRELTWSVMKAIAEKSLTSDWQMIFMPPLFFFFQFTSEDSTLQPREEKVPGDQPPGRGTDPQGTQVPAPGLSGGCCIGAPAVCPHRPPQGEVATARALGARAGLWPSGAAREALPLCATGSPLPRDNRELDVGSLTWSAGRREQPTSGLKDSDRP